uniref:Uncharacterized protein n=1 Tax=Hanusia phi TaxID=3032 RepID=A0A6T7NU88_9CRYP
MAGWTGHLPQKQSNTYNVGLTHAAAYESVQARKEPHDFHVRSGTPIAGLSAFVPRAKELSPGLSHRQVCRSAREYKGDDPRYAAEKSFTARFGQSDRSRPATARTLRPAASENNTQARKVIVGSKIVTVNTRTGEAKSGGFNINSFANESAGGRSKNPIPKLRVNSDGLVQLNPNTKANLYIGDLTQFWTLENPYQTTSRSSGQPQTARSASSGVHHVAGYCGHVPLHPGNPVPIIS